MNSDEPITPSGSLPQAPPSVPDHELLRPVGRGAYGEVWLARNIMGEYRAVKVVYRNRFDHDRPYQRELEGIKNFEPVSRTHESQVDILHVGQNQQAGYFFYVMELADDQVTGQQINPATYQPESLKSRLQRNRRLAPSECTKLGLSLTTALAHLHKNGLVHRDVKPSNIIFINGQAKLADIGLVSSFDATMSYVGTLGFSPPEGPGTTTADTYSLGKVLYEAATGRDRQDFPDLPTQLDGSEEEQAALLELNEIILKACDNNIKHRYQTVEAMHADLALLKDGQSVARLRTLERLLGRIKKIGILGTLVIGAVLAFVIWQTQQRLKIQRLTVAETMAHTRSLLAEQTAETEAKQLLETLRLIGENEADDATVQVLRQLLEAQEQSLIGNSAAVQKVEASLRKIYKPIAQINAPDGRILQVQCLTFGTNHTAPTAQLERLAPYIPQELQAFLAKLGPVPVPHFKHQTAFPALMVWLTALDPKTDKFVDCQDVSLEILSSNGELYCGRRSNASESGPVGFEFNAFPRTDHTLVLQMHFDEGQRRIRVDVANPHVSVPAIWSGQPLPQRTTVQGYEVVFHDVVLRTNRFFQNGAPYWFPSFQVMHGGAKANGWQEPWWTEQDAFGNKDHFIPAYSKVMQFSVTFYPNPTNTEAAVLVGSSTPIQTDSFQSNVLWNFPLKTRECELVPLGIFSPGTQVFLGNIYQTNPPAFMDNGPGWGARYEYNTIPKRGKRWISHCAPVPSILVRAPRIEPDNLLGVRLRDDNGHVWFPRPDGNDTEEERLYAFLIDLPPDAKQIVADFVLLPTIKADFMVQLPVKK